MNILEMIHQNSTLGEASGEDGSVANPILHTPSMELDRTKPLENPNLYYLISGDVKAPCPLRNGSPDIFPSTEEEIMALGYPSKVEENIFEGHGFVGEFNPKYGMSNWVSECVTLYQKNKFYIDRNLYEGDLFYEDEDIYFKRNVTLADYKESVYTRGHLAAAGNHGYNSAAYINTFCIKNIAPMHKKVNQILGRIEIQGRDFLNTYDVSYIITGPVFDMEREPIFIKEGSKVRVPDAFFKVLAHYDTHKNHKTLQCYGYIVNNYPDDHEDTIKALGDISYARRYLDSISKKTGLKFFSEVPPEMIMEPAWQKKKKPRGCGA